jgi:predicted nucleic acid-binding protein
MRRDEKGLDERGIETYVIDASVALKWHLDDEEAIKEARQLLSDYGDGKIAITAPKLMLVEVGNAFNVAVMRARLTEEVAFQDFQEIFELDIPLIEYTNFLISAWKFARAHNRSVYDSVYVVTAQHLGCDFYTGDKRLYNALRGKFSWVKWIGDYRKQSVAKIQCL